MYCSPEGGEWTSTESGSSAGFIGIVSGNAVAGDGVGQYHDTVAFRTFRRRRDGRSTGTVGPEHTLDLAKVIRDSFLPRCALRATVYAFCAS